MGGAMRLAIQTDYTDTFVFGFDNDRGIELHIEWYYETQ